MPMLPVAAVYSGVGARLHEFSPMFVVNSLTSNDNNNRRAVICSDRQISLGRFYWKSRHSIFITISACTFGLILLFGFCLLVNGTTTDRKTAYAITGAITVVFLVVCAIVAGILRYREIIKEEQRTAAIAAATRIRQAADVEATTPMIAYPILDPVRRPISSVPTIGSSPRRPTVAAPIERQRSSSSAIVRSPPILPPNSTNRHPIMDEPPSYECAVEAEAPPPYISCL